MGITITSNAQKSPYVLLGNGMILFGSLGILNCVLNFALRWMTYEYYYMEGVTPLIYILSLFSSFSLFLIVLEEVIAIVIFYKTVKATRLPELKQIMIIHIVYLLYLIGYHYFLPWILYMFDLHPYPDSQTYTLIYRVVGFGIVIILVLSDWFLYQLYKKILHQYPIKMTFLMYLPFVLIAIRVINQLIGYISSNLMLPVVLASFAFIIPIFWILLGYNFKLIAPLSENTAGYTVGEPRLDYYTPQGGQERIELNPQDTSAALNPYGNCPKCGKPRISLIDVFCSNCGNRF